MPSPAERLVKSENGFVPFTVPAKVNVAAVSKFVASALALNVNVSVLVEMFVPWPVATMEKVL